jgi:hypothetical protein
MYVILLAWLTLANPASPFCAHLTWEQGLAEVGFLEEPQDKQDERQWMAGTYRGITIGKSTATELFQKWGKPKDIGHWEWDNPEKPKFRLYHFDSQEELPDRFDSQEKLPGRITVEVEMKTGKVVGINIPLYGLPLSEAIELFGKNYIETRYKSCKCDPDDESPIFESPDGNFIYIEYPSRGISMVFDYRGNTKVITSIQFVDKPIGFKSAKECETIPECRPKRKSVRRKRI